jgi:cytidylate kinase
MSMSVSPIRVVTIEREYASGAADIADRLARRLGWKLWDQALTLEIARQMECDCRVVEEHEEKRDPLFYRLLKGFMRGSHEGTTIVPPVKNVDTDCIRAVAERVVKAAAESGNCVTVGRGSAYYLQERPDVFHVFIYAPFEEKVRRLEGQGKSHSEATHLVETVDRDRSAFIKQYFGVDWPTRDRFHLMINSSMGEEAAVDTIVGNIALLDQRAAAPSARK